MTKQVPRLEQMKLDLIIKRRELQQEELTTATMLQYAIEAEEICQSLGPFDKAFPYFKSKQLDFENAALYIEQLSAGEAA